MLQFVEKDSGTIQVWERGRIIPPLQDVKNPGRHIYMHKDFVVKIDHNPQGTWVTQQTAREIDFWTTLVEDKEYFAQILDYGKTPRGKWWLKQKRYYPDKAHCENFRSTLMALEFKYQLRDLMVGDNPPFFVENGNWMCSEGEVIIYDWGVYKA